MRARAIGRSLAHGGFVGANDELTRQVVNMMERMARAMWALGHHRIPADENQSEFLLL